jgi:hypothetical protein
MADGAEESHRQTATPGRVWANIGSRLARPGRARAAIGLGTRFVVLLSVIWALAGPVNQRAMIAGAAPAPPGDSPSVYQDTGFAVADGPISNYFAARGGVRTFGPPVSNAFPLLGEQIQIFRDFVLKVDANGSVSTVDLFAMNGIPFRNVGGRIIPDIDQALVASAPVPGTPDYEPRVQELIRANAPDQWEGQPVGFYKAFLGTVQYEDAFPNGGNRALLPGFAQEVWGLPVSRPTQDPQNQDIVLLRWERGVMAWNRQTGTVTAIPLGETFKAVLTGLGLGPERTAAASGSPYLLQLDPAAPDGVARPGELPNTVLATAFQPGSATINAAQYSYPTMTPTPYGYNPSGIPTYQLPYATPTPMPYQPSNPTNGFPGNPNQGINPQPGVSQPVGNGLPGAINGPNGAPGTQTGSDPCYGDEQITFAPEQPRVANEVLIAVTSSRPHPYGRLAGTERTNFVRERPGQLGYVWEWTVALSYPGQHEYTFYVDSTIPCKKIQLTVMESLATKTPKPTKTPTPYGWDNNNNSNNNNGNNNNGNNNNNNDNNNGTVPYRDPYQFANVTYDAFNCSFFYSQGEAQRVLRANPSDPNNLDSEDGVIDGIACTTYHNFQYSNDNDYNIVQRTTPTPTPNFFNPTLTPTPISNTATSTLTPTPSPAGTATPQATVNPHYYNGQGDKYSCIDFLSQAEAQAVLRDDPNDPNKLDTYNHVTAKNEPDGIACRDSIEAPEWGQMFFFPEPYNFTPVPTPQGGRKTSPTYTPTSNSVATSTPTTGTTPVAGTRTPISVFPTSTSR